MQLWRGVVLMVDLSSLMVDSPCNLDSSSLLVLDQVRIYPAAVCMMYAMLCLAQPTCLVATALLIAWGVRDDLGQVFLDRSSFRFTRTPCFPFILFIAGCQRSPWGAAEAAAVAACVWPSRTPRRVGPSRCSCWLDGRECRLGNIGSHLAHDSSLSFGTGTGFVSHHKFSEAI